YALPQLPRSLTRPLPAPRTGGAMTLQRRDFLRVVGAAALGGAATASWHESADADGPPAPKPIKIGQIGVGHAHAGKLSVYRRSADYEVVGVAEPDAELRKGAETQAAYRDLPWMTQEQLLNVPGLQAVLVETRVRDLLNTAAACVAAGKHVHLDKPAGGTLPPLPRPLGAAAQKKLPVPMGYMYRYKPPGVLLPEVLPQGRLGDLFE